MYNKFKKYIVHAENLKEFCEKFHKPGKITDFNRNEDYEGHKRDIEKFGFTFIPRHTSITGEIVSYYGKI